MIRRWITRGLALALLALCVAVWVGSYWQYGGVVYTCGGVRFCALAVNCGRLLVEADYPPPNGHWHALRGAAFEWTKWDADMDFKFLGFGVMRQARIVEMTVPLWFPTSLSGVLFWFVWRKTRSRLVDRAFPGEVGAGKTG
jgi:hypothetical protein